MRGDGSGLLRRGRFRSLIAGLERRRHGCERRQQQRGQHRRPHGHVLLDADFAGDVGLAVVVVLEAVAHVELADGDASSRE